MTVHFVDEHDQPLEDDLPIRLPYGPSPSATEPEHAAPYQYRWARIGMAIVLAPAVIFWVAGALGIG